MSLIKHKKVELTELFYDLIYVYAISQITSVIHHVHHGVVTIESFIIFSLSLIIFINSWMIQTVFTNRFGSNSLQNIIFMFAQMFSIFVAANTLSVGSWEAISQEFLLFVSAISFLLLLQYLFEYFRASSTSRVWIHQFFLILGIRFVWLIISAFLSPQIALWMAALGVIATWLLPAILVNRTRQKNMAISTINFPHLLERLSLLVIITFGEMIIGISDYFGVETLSIFSVAIFSVVLNLFMVYIVEVDHLIEDKQPSVTGNAAIYWHYLIFFGLNFITVSLKFLGEDDVSARFSVSLLYLGILLSTIGVLLHATYNKVSHQFGSSFYCLQISLPVFSFLISFLFLEQKLVLATLAALSTLIQAVSFVRFNMKNQLN